jgi:hypothetical protein
MMKISVSCCLHVHSTWLALETFILTPSRPGTWTWSVGA